MAKSTSSNIKPISYAKLTSNARDSNSRISLPLLIPKLEDAWLLAYRQSCHHKPDILCFTDSGYTYLFDFNSSARTGSCDTVDDRVIVVHGFSHQPKSHRDANRIRGFLGGGITIPNRGNFDKGHFAAHSAGGGLDVNLFPQRASFNRGWSAAGKIYRQMENQAAANPGSFIFSRPIYNDDSWIPKEIEYGVLLSEGRLWVETFRN